MEQPTRRRTLVIAVVVSVMVLGVALVFVGSLAVSGVAGNALTLHRANAAAGSLGLTRAAVSQAMLFGADHAAGIVGPGEWERALEQAEVSIEDLRYWVATLPQETATSVQPAIDAAAAVVGSIRERRSDDAVASFALLEDAARNGLHTLQRLQADTLGAIDDVESLAGRAGLVARLLVTLVVPATALLVHRQVVHRRLVVAETRMAAERDAQRSKQQFIAGISHELRTPLTAIYGYASLLAESPEPATSSMADTVVAETVELTRMVEDLIAFARGLDGSQALTAEVFALEGVLSEILVTVPRGRLHDVSSGGLILHTDRRAVSHILRNLVSNAVRHGGPRIVVLATADRDLVRIAVADDGPGCDPSALDVATPFRTADGEAVVAGSIGLGLTVATSQARLLGGSIQHRRCGEWTQFALALPTSVSVRGEVAA